MTPTHKWITAALILMTVYNTAVASRNQGTTDNRLRSLVQSTERLEQKNVALSVSVHQNERALRQEDTHLGQRIDGVELGLKETTARATNANASAREVGEDLEKVLGRLSDVEVAVGMPGSGVVIEPSVELIQPHHTVNNCKRQFRTVDWTKHGEWALSRVKRGWNCSAIAHALVTEKRVTGTAALAVCAALDPRLPWAENRRRLKRWSQSGVNCNALSKRLRQL